MFPLFVNERERFIFVLLSRLVIGELLRTLHNKSAFHLLVLRVPQLV